MQGIEENRDADTGNQPLVSVIIPTYNCARYIEEAIDSVLEQFYKNYEVIVIDDGSTDDTRERTAKYGDNIRCIHQQNQGLSSARNQGVNLANGSLIAFLDADDKFLPGKLERQVALFREKPGIDLVSSGIRVIDESGREICDLNWWEYFPVLDCETFFIYKTIQVGAIMVKKNALLKIGGFNPHLDMAEDVELLFRLFLAGCQAEWLCQVTSCYRLHRQSMTGKNFYKSANRGHEVIADFFSRRALPASIRGLRNQSLYEHLVWCAWQSYMNNSREHMYEFLYRAAAYRTIPAGMLEDEWLEKFTGMTEPYGKEFTGETITADRGWKELMKEIDKQVKAGAEGQLPWKILDNQKEEEPVEEEEHMFEPGDLPILIDDFIKE